MSQKKKLVIVGGGYVGFEVARALDAHAEVTLVEQREAFVHPPAAIRALLEPSLLKQIILPYDRLLKQGNVVCGHVVEVSQSAVTLDNGTQIPADIVVVATGSSYAAPFKPSGSNVEDFVAASRAVSAQLAQAKTVAIVGAGPVGCELAGEIASARPQTKVTLISSDDTLFPMYPVSLGAQLKRKLEALGVVVVMGQRAQDLQFLDKPYNGSVTLSSGEVVSADLIFPAIGSRPQTLLLDGLPGVVKSPSGRISTDKWLRPSDLPNVFIAGDIADVGDTMTIVAISRQNPWLIRTLKAVLAGAAVEDQKPYKPWKRAPILVPLGPKFGNSWIFATVGNWITWIMKGKELFVPKYRKAFGLNRRGT